MQVSLCTKWIATIKHTQADVPDMNTRTPFIDDICFWMGVPATVGLRLPILDTIKLEEANTDLYYEIEKFKTLANGESLYQPNFHLSQMNLVENGFSSRGELPEWTKPFLSGFILLYLRIAMLNKNKNIVC
ncbi:MAG: hypothetical protein WAK17_19825 [Candidatus Nitrosopolaris sp.]